MLPLAFLGGVAAGAAGLLAAALWDGKKAEAEYSPSLKSAGALDAEAAARQLNSYFFKAQALYSKVNDAMMASSELISTPIELPDDGLLQKAANALGGGANRICRGLRSSQMARLREDAVELYGRYKGVFSRANAILREQGKAAVSLSPISLDGEFDKINNSIDNDDWSFDLDKQADQIRGFIEGSCSIAEELIDLLEGSKPRAIEQDAISE